MDSKRVDRLLAFAPLFDETDLGASSYQSFLEATVILYGRSWSDVAFLVGDNCKMNQLLSRLCNKPLIGCASHRLNLEVKRLFKEHTDVLDKIQDVTKGLTSSKPAAQQLEDTGFVAVMRNKTRWTSTFAMVERVFRIKSVEVFSD